MGISNQNSSTSILTVRRYYRRLHRSGRLYTIYKTHYHDFLQNSPTSLSQLACRGCIGHNGKDIYFIIPMPIAWHTRTALLFLRLGYQNLRRLLKEKDRCNQPFRRQYRLPSLLQPCLSYNEILDLDFGISNLRSHTSTSRPYSFRENPAHSDFYSSKSSSEKRDTGTLDTETPPPHTPDFGIPDTESEQESGGGGVEESIE